MEKPMTILVIISANAEWRVVRNNLMVHDIQVSPFGEWFEYEFMSAGEIDEPVIFFHGGWGKVAAAASTQFTIDKWHPEIILNLGTCGGFAGQISRGEIILADKTIIYDIYEQMGDPEDHINHYITKIDNSWISEPLPIPVRQTLLVSGDRDLFADEISNLKEKYGAIAGDWESGAIAWVCKRNHTRCLLLRGVTDLVGGAGGEAYNGNINWYHKNTEIIMNTLLDSLPEWIVKFHKYAHSK